VTWTRFVIGICLIVLLLATAFAQRDPAGVAARAFLIEPYIQLGDNPQLSDPEKLSLVWHTADVDANWTVRVRLRNTDEWKDSPARGRRVIAQTIEPHRVYDPRRW
jgi:hypothetical protein